MSSNLSAPHLHDEEAAYAYVEARLWPQGATCPKCGGRDRITKLKGKSTRIGTYYCNACRKPFTVKVGTLFESSHVPMRVWLQAISLICGSKKGISSNQLHRILGVTLKTAWFMSHRIREAMRTDGAVDFGNGGGFVEVDETFIGTDKDKLKEGKRPGGGVGHKHKLLALVDRSTGRARSIVVDDLKATTLGPILRENIAKEATLMTDDYGVYRGLGRDFATHLKVRHKMGEYVNRRNPDMHTNTVEGYFSIFKRGMKGVYQHCAKRHLHRYAAEFEFRYNNRIANGVDDAARAELMLIGFAGKRLAYQTIGA